MDLPSKIRDHIKRSSSCRVCKSFFPEFTVSILFVSGYDSSGRIDDCTESVRIKKSAEIRGGRSLGAVSGCKDERVRHQLSEDSRLFRISGADNSADVAVCPFHAVGSPFPDLLAHKFIDNLEKLAKFEGYYDDARSEFEALRKKLSHNLAKDLDYNKTSLRQLLTSDLATAYYYQRGAAESQLRFDKQWQEAVKLLKDPERYRQILSPKP